jgi:hypothetical protein
MKLDVLIVIEQAGVVGAGPATVRVESARLVLVFGYHDDPPMFALLDISGSRCRRASG